MIIFSFALLFVVGFFYWMTNPLEGRLQQTVSWMCLSAILLTLGLWQAQEIMQKDQPYNELMDDRRVKHQQIVKLEKQVLTNPYALNKLEQLIKLLTHAERYIEAGQVYCQIEKIRPLNDIERLNGAECLIHGSQKTIAPKARLWIDSIPPSSPLYFRAQFLRQTFPSLS